MLTLDGPVWFYATMAAVILLLAYLVQLNRLLNMTPEGVRRLSPSRWTQASLVETYKRLEKTPITTQSYAGHIPPKLERRYIITGGSGLVGGYIVLQLLERGQPPESIRIVDFREPNRSDMTSGPPATVEFVKTDISSIESTNLAFAKPWHSSVASLPLTIFHTAAVIVPSDRSKLTYGFCEAINVFGTRNVLNASRLAGADILVSTTSGSISIRPVEFWMTPWNMFSDWPRHYWQVLDEQDFFEPPRRHQGYYSNYAASKAAAERIVCGANSKELRTGSIRAANGIYGNPTDNTVGGPLHMRVQPTWTKHCVQSFVHAINVAVAHLQFEAVLASPNSAALPQAGRPFVITDPNTPITYGDVYFLIQTLSVTPFQTLTLQPLVMLLLSYAIEWYRLLLVRNPWLRMFLPLVSGDIQHLQPALFSICTHLVASNEVAGQPVEMGGLGYTGLLTTEAGMVQEIIEWNREHKNSKENGKTYQSSVSLAVEIQRAALGVKSTRRLNIETDGAPF
ncbi:hypothetical protein B0H63DRAFT_31580 [Podospora didyma]|uniref:3-beta hydroxysteroid dehydrogenase/isomerase domain-containing protein n=1 Tax=Podospora didyma TaxID=330526 RepID=A0AAE0P645_9PEZI|nr:hypothetical protein B0H63DRAFT_31580 [Podospora didyma]